MPNDVLDSMREVAGPRGVSAFVTESVQDRLRRQRLAEIGAEVEAASGPFTAEEREWASRVLRGEDLTEPVLKP
ncbi:MAG: hypothetical protein LBK95_18540 [Bifidobacteriaceae bacterium]|jgi:hypothetical protein|nr:hypothetical protein [Bifidobacteriaceae bacterium]